MLHDVLRKRLEFFLIAAVSRKIQGGAITHMELGQQAAVCKDAVRADNAGRYNRRTAHGREQANAGFRLVHASVFAARALREKPEDMALLEYPDGCLDGTAIRCAAAHFEWNLPRAKTVWKSDE